MRHLKSGRKLGRNSSSRSALMRNMVTSLLEYEHIETTEAKAKELRSWADKMITLGKKGSLHDHRRAMQVLRSKVVAHKLFTTLASRYATRAGGYTRIYKIRPRVGDNASMAIIELVDRVVEMEKKVKKKEGDVKSSEEKVRREGKKTQKASSSVAGRERRKK